MKKAKVKKITKFDKRDNYGNFSFSIEFDNGDKGYYTSKFEDQTKFVVDKEVEYIIEEKEGKNNNKYYKITLPDTSGSKSFWGGKPQIDPRVQMISFAMSYTKDLVVGGKLELNKLPDQFNVIYKLMTEKL